MTRLVIVIVLAVAAAEMGCGSGAGEACVGSLAQAIYGGSADAEAFGLNDNAPAGAVVAIVTESKPKGWSLCSGVVVAQRFVLTAAHCAPGALPSAIRVSLEPSVRPFGSSCASASAAYAVVAITRHPAVDAMLLALTSSAFGLTGVPVVTSAPSVGQAAIIAGYGLTEMGTFGQRIFAPTTIADVGAGTIEVDSGTDGGACVGDSGGPLLVRDASGWKVAGVLSEGSGACAGQDVYVDTAAIAAWIGSNIGG